MLRKILKYLIILLIACAVVFVLFSCRSSKKAAPAQPAVTDSGKQAENQSLFAHMYVDGCAQRMKGNLQEALRLFVKCRDIDPSNAAVRYELATIYKLLGNRQEALQNAKLCATAEPMNEWYQLLLIDCLIDEKQYANAIRVRENLVRNFPARSDFREELAIDYAISGQYDKSYKIYEELERTYGLSEQITLNKVKLLKSQKKFREIEGEFLKLSASAPGEARYYAYLAEFYLANGEPEKAKRMYDEILKADPQNPTVHLALHDYYKENKDEETAFSHLKKAFINPDLDIATKTEIVGSFYTRAEEGSEEAQRQGTELVTIMLRVHPASPEANALYGDFLMLSKKTAEASRYYYTAALNERKDFRVWENLLYVDNELGRFDSLARHSALAIELFPNQPRNYLYNGLAATQLKNYTKAVESLRDGLGFVVDNQALRLDFLRLLGDAYHYSGDFERSDRTFEEALRIDADNPYVLNNYAYYLSLRADQLDKAEKLSRRANELQPDNRNYMDTYGWILYRQKKYSQAEEWLRRAATGSRNATILEHYGDALYRMNKPAEALMQWNAAREAGGSSADLLRKIKERKADD